MSVNIAWHAFILFHEFPSTITRLTIMPVVSSSLAFIHMILALLEYCKDLGLFQYLMIHCYFNIGQLLSLACFILISRKIILSIRLLQITLSKTSVWFCLPYWANDVSYPTPPPFFFTFWDEGKRLEQFLWGVLLVCQTYVIPKIYFSWASQWGGIGPYKQFYHAK